MLYCTFQLCSSCRTDAACLTVLLSCAVRVGLMLCAVLYFPAVQFMWDCLFESLERSKKPEMSAGCILAHCMGLGKTLSVSYILSTAFRLKLLSSLFFFFTSPSAGMHVFIVCVCTRVFVHMCECVTCVCAYV